MKISRRSAALIAACVLVSACGGAGSGDPIRFVVPAHASFSQIADTLAARGIISAKPVFEVYGRVNGAAGKIKPGTYAFRKGTSWNRVLGDMKAGKVLTAKLVI